MRSVSVRFVVLGVSLASVSALLCGCPDDLDFFDIPDAGADAGPPAPPPPPVFPLKAGDEVIYPGIGGRAEPCDVEGQCDRALRATYTINDVVLDEETNRWTVNADYLYEMQVAVIEAAEMGQLFLSRAAPFDDIDNGGRASGTADFAADGAPTDAMIPNKFPFFHFEPEYATREDSAYRAAADEFQARIKELDPDAEIENQAAESKIEAYFKDELGAQPMLHKVRVDFHPFGFVCAWDERLTTWQDGMERAEGAFSGSNIPLANIFPSQVQLIRDDVRYQCSCFTKKCQNGNGDNAVCLDPTDPDAPAGSCE